MDTAEFAAKSPKHRRVKLDQFGAGAKLRAGNDRRELCSPAMTVLSVHLNDEGHLLDTPKALDSKA